MQTDPERHPDHLVTVLADEVIDAGIAHAEAFRVNDDPIDITFNACLQASQSRTSASATPSPEPLPPPFVDSIAQRGLCFAGVTQHALLSSVHTSSTQVIQRHSATFCTGEAVVLTFQLVLETTIRAAYKGVASEKQWVLRRASGEPASLQDEPHTSVSPEAAVLRQLEALRAADIATVFAFASPANQRTTGPLGNFMALLDTPIYRPLVGHLESEVVNCRHVSSSKVASLVKVTPHPARRTAQRVYMYMWTVTLQQGGPADGCWMTDSVQAVSVTFLDSWPRMN